MANRNLNAAKRAKKDEFYTQLPDIERELRHYWPHFRGKTVLCNCDDPYESNFFKYFALRFNQLGLRRLLCTCYNGSPVRGTELLLHFDGEADVVVTNPPFSLFREYVGQLMDYGKKFLIVAPQNAITYKEIFPLIKENRIWLGFKSGDMAFKVPADSEPRTTRYWVDEGGQKWRSLGNICWFTNLDHTKRHEELDLVCRYNPDDYPKYDNYDAIEVSKVVDIPCDYDGAMGVPITFLDKYNPEQFEVVGVTESEGKGFSNGLWHTDSGVAQAIVNGKKKYKRVFIRNKHSQQL